ncbi:MAG TPA: hypothetical protein DCY91_03595, partial [Cyanobacteria bacterium UBA11370]|nr:hypothetical protein [Cyanobacteria bacterium UBA11370]
MSGRKFARKKISSINQTSVPNPLQPRRLKIPPHLTQSDTQQQEKRSIPEQLEKASKFGYNGLDLPVDVSTTSPPSVQNQLVTGELDNTLQPQPVPETEVASSPENNPEQQALSTPDSGASQAQEQAISVEELSEQQELDSQKTDDTIQQQDIPDAEPEVMAKPETETAQPQEEKSPLQAQLDKASHFNHNFLEIPVNAAGKSSPLVQRMPTLDRLDHQDELQTVERANPVLNGLHLLKAQTGVQTKKTTPDGITEPEESPETLEDAETENGTVTNQNGKRAAGENKPVTRVVKTNTDSEAGEKSADPKNEGKDQTVNPDVASANIQTANQEAQQAVEAVTQKEPAQTKPTVTEQGTETKKDNTPAGTATAKGSDQEGKAEGKGSAPEKTPTGKGTVEPEAVAKVTTQTEKVAQKQAEATTAVTQTQTQMAAAASTSQQLANTGLAFAAPEIKPTFVTTEEGISALAPKKILGSAGNGKVIYQTDNPQESLAAAEQGISVQPVPDAQVAQSTEKQRLQAEAAIAQFMASGSERIATISSLGQTIAPRIQASRGQAIASVDTAISQNQAAITNAITQARTQVQSQGQAAKNQVTGQHQATVAAIKSSTTAARDRLQSSYQASLNQLTQIESGMAGKIAQPFTQAANDFRAAGMKVGQEAIQVGENYKSQFQGESPPEPSNFVTEFLESFDRDTYVQNWRQAKIKAAGDVAENYRAGLVQNANEKAGELSTSQSEVVKGMREVVTTTRNDLQVKYTAALQELTQSEQSALQMATETLNGQLQGIDQNLTSTLGSLDQMQATQLAQLNSLGQQQKLGINANAEQVTAALQEGVNQATTSLQGAFQQFADQAQGMETPNLQVVKSVIAEAQGQLDGMMASTQTSLETGISNSEQGIVQQAQGMLGSINTVGQQAATSSAAVSEEFNTSIAQEVQSATQAFTQLQTGHTTAVNGSAEKTVGEFKNFTTGVQQKLDGVIQNLTGKLTESVTQLENGLRGSLKGSDQNPSIQKAIEDKAKEAADQVQPAWKSVVKVLIDIVITVAVTVAIAALAASGVGLVAAIGLAALIGAGGALLKQGANDLIDGKMSSWQTYATQAGFGAVGGVLQLVGIRGADKAAGLLTNTIAKTGAKFGLESAGEMGADITQRLAAGEQFSLAMVGVSFGTSLLGNAGGEAISSGFGKLGTKLGIDQIDNVALKTGGEFVTDTIGETATDVTSQVVFEGKDLSWQTVGESAGTSAFGNVVGRGANRAYGDRLRNLGGGAPTSTNVPNLDQSLPPVADISTPTPIIDPNTNQPIGQTPVSTPIIDPNTNQPIGQTPVPTPIIDPNT